jgi:DNA modification methylase
MVINQKKGDNYVLYNGDCVEIAKNLPSNSIDYSIFSPPFAQLYTYSDLDRDMGNCNSHDDFLRHFSFLAKELYRLIKPGRLVSFHCMNIPAMKERDGFIGLKDFRGDLIREFQSGGFVFHAEVVIWKDPLIEATRTKSLGLLHKQLCKDSSRVRQGIPDYIITMRKPGENQTPITHKDGLSHYAGSGKLPHGNRSHNIWRSYASPVWMDIRQTNTLNFREARSAKDEKHICPLQLDTIERCLTLWTNEGDVVLSPFSGIGSEGYMALQMNRKFIGIELKETYYNLSTKHLEKASQTTMRQEALFG